MNLLSLVTAFTVLLSPICSWAAAGPSGPPGIIQQYPQQDAAAAAGGADFASDAFTDVNATNLESHTATGGGTWTVQGSNTPAMMKIDTNHAYCAISGDWTVYYHSSTPADADYSVHATVHMNAATSTGGGIAGRINTATGAGYMVYWSGGAGAWRLVRFNGSSETIIGTPYVGDSPATSDRLVNLRMNGTTISVDIGGVQRITVTDATYTATGKAGLIPNFFDNASDRWIDDWGANDAP